MRVFLLNPNSSASMTHGVQQALQDVKSVEITFYTAPKESPASINNQEDLEASTKVVLDDVKNRLDELAGYDAILVACYSVHPLVTRLSELLEKSAVVVTGIFESSIVAAMSLLPPYGLFGKAPQTWGVVTTGAFWEDHLSRGVWGFLGQANNSQSSKFAGVYSTGLVAGDFHGDVSQQTIEDRLKTAAKKLLAGSEVRCVLMGCAGMAGLEKIIRDAAVEEYGKQVGGSVYIIDGVKAGVSLLESTVRNKRAFQS